MPAGPSSDAWVDLSKTWRPSLTIWTYCVAPTSPFVSGGAQLHETPGNGMPLKLGRRRRWDARGELRRLAGGVDRVDVPRDGPRVRARLHLRSAGVRLPRQAAQRGRAVVLDRVPEEHSLAPERVRCARDGAVDLQRDAPARAGGGPPRRGRRSAARRARWVRRRRARCPPRSPRRRV